VLRYASDFIPAWAGAISIDLLPAVLVFILATVHGAIRRQEEGMPFAQRITAAELLEAIEVQRALTDRGIDIREAVARADERDRADALRQEPDTDPRSREDVSEPAGREPATNDPDDHKVTSLELGKLPRKGPTS
jgi:hypothetical protein